MCWVQLGLPWLLVPAWVGGYNGAAACLALAFSFSFLLWPSGVALLRRDSTRGLRWILVVHTVVQAGNFSQVLVLLGWQFDSGLPNMLWMVPNFAALMILQLMLSLQLGSLLKERALAQWQPRDGRGRRPAFRVACIIVAGRCVYRRRQVLKVT
jgi:hypothetical protein